MAKEVIAILTLMSAMGRSLTWQVWVLSCRRTTTNSVRLASLTQAIQWTAFWSAA